MDKDYTQHRQHEQQDCPCSFWHFLPDAAAVLELGLAETFFYGLVFLGLGMLMVCLTKIHGYPQDPLFSFPFTVISFQFPV